MLIEMTFTTQEVREALDTESEILPPDLRRIGAVLTIDISDKYPDVQVVFLRDKLRKTYDAAISQGSDEVTVLYEAPSDEDWAKYGFVRKGDFMVMKES